MFSSLALKNTPHKKWWVLIAMSLSLGMTYIDQTGLAVALPKIQQTFNISSSLLQWVVNGYLLSLAVFLIIGGRLGDLFEHHKVFLAGVFLFMAASISCAIAEDINWLIISRVIQGAGAACMLPNSAVILIHTFGPEEKGKAMGIYVGSALLFSPLALILGGFFTEFLTWRLIFWINLPLCLICFWITSQVTESQLQEKKPRFDWLGAATLVLAVSTLVIALMESANSGLEMTAIYSLIVISLVLFAVGFLFRKKIHPIIDYSLFRNNIFLCAVILFFAMSLSMAFFVFDAIFFQEVLAYSPAQTAFLFFPNIVFVALAAPLAGRTLDKYGYKKPVIIGLLLVLTGLLLKAYLIPLQNYWYLLPSIFLLGVGGPFVISPINTAALSSVELNKRGTASGILNAVRQISNSITLAVLTIIILRSNKALLANFLKFNQNLYPDITLTKLENLLHQYHWLSIPEGSLAQLIFTVRNSFAAAYSISLYISAIFIFFVLIQVLILFRRA